MNSGINFVVKRVDPQTRAILRRIRVLRVVAIGVLSVVTIISIVLFIVIAASPLPRLREKEESIFLSLNTLNQKMQKVIFVDKQLDHVKTVLQTRSNLPEVIDQVLATFPPSVQVIAYNATPSQMDLTLEATTLSDIDLFIKALSKVSEEEKIYPNIILEDLLVNQGQGLYQFRISMTM